MALAFGDSSDPASLSGYWSDLVTRSLGRDFRPLQGNGGYYAGDAPPGACDVSADEATGNAFYCPGDATIRWDWDLMWTLEYDYDDLGPLTVAAHEYGHHLQSLLGRPVLSIRAELQADCFAGMYLRHLDDLGYLPDRGILDALRTIWSFGDQESGSGAPVRWTDPGVHGRSDERRRAAGVGYSTESIDYCLAFNGMAEQPPVALDDHVEIYLSPGISVTQRSDGGFDFDVLGTEVSYTEASARSGSTAAGLLPGAVAAWLPGARAVLPPVTSWVDDFGWAYGDAALLRFRRSGDQSHPDVAGAASLGVEPDGVTRLFIASTPSSGATDPLDSTLDALIAVFWGYCDPRAVDPSNCPASATSRSPAPTPNSGQDEPERRRRERLLIGIAPADIQRKCRAFREHGQFDPFEAGAVAAIDCAVKAGGIDHFAYFLFPDQQDLDAYFDWRLRGVDIPQGVEGCWNGERGESTWAHGRIACWVTTKGSPKVAHLRWTDDRAGLMGVLNGTTKDITTLMDWWAARQM
ncbi:MAG: neutral zinc metallopeptidase [Chloroflexota bacterium]